MFTSSVTLLLCAFLAANPSEVQTSTPVPKAPPQTSPALPKTGHELKSLSGFGLEDGTPVKLRLTRNLSSGTDKKGDQVDFEVLEEVKSGDVVVIPRGGIAWATITEAEHKKSMGRGGKLNVNIDSVRLQDGEKAALRSSNDNKGGGHVGAMTGAIVATTILFWPAAPLFLFVHGKDINIPKGTEITAYIAGDVPLDKTKFELQDSSQASTATAATAATTTVLSLNSTPQGADIELDGSFIGSTPSSSNVAAGEHQIKITKRGFKPWERKLKTSSGTANLNADLAKDSSSNKPDQESASSPNSRQQVVSTVYITPTGDQFDIYLGAALRKKAVPLTVVEKPENAAFILKTTQVETHKETTGSVQLVKDGAILWSYSVNKGRGAKNLQSMAEAMAKHLKSEYFHPTSVQVAISPLPDRRED